MIPATELSNRRKKLLEMMEEDSVAVLYAGVPKNKSADETYPFEVNRNFYYLTGIDQEDSRLILLKSKGELKEYLFVSPYDEKKEKWYGKKLTLSEASHISGVSNVLTTKSFESQLHTFLSGSLDEFSDTKCLYIDLEKELKVAPSTSTNDVKNTLSAAYQEIEFINVYPLITRLRLHKSNREINELRYAIRATRDGLLAAWAKLKPGVYEYEIADEFLRAVNDSSGYQGLAFPTIAASGIHATILHYPTPLAKIEDGDLLLLDLGARCSYYCADVSRTVPANGRFTPLQLKAYNIVLSCNKMVANMAKPGVTIDELQTATKEFLARECVLAGLLEKKEDIEKYYFHGVSHLIGLDTHDPLDDPNSKEYRKMALEPGMVISNEPGLYMADKGIGIRIEDDLLITNDGCEVLTADIIKEPHEIENLLTYGR
ncbi:MAG: aminopeptidase P N-terminal domain-containing protein [Bacilli bacterium]|nr:aminopeptidase P N-terminal domain-containing protein [Bacilli bacterium]